MLIQEFRDKFTSFLGRILEYPVAPLFALPLEGPFVDSLGAWLGRVAWQRAPASRRAFAWTESLRDHPMGSWSSNASAGEAGW